MNGKFERQRQEAHKALDQLFDEISRTRFSGEATLGFGCNQGGIRNSNLRFAVGTGPATLRTVMEDFLRIRKQAHSQSTKST